MKGNTSKTFVFFMMLLIAQSQLANATLISSGICYAGCAGVTVACFAAAGAIFGTLDGAQIAANPALVRCNAAFSRCEQACHALATLVS